MVKRLRKVDFSHPSGHYTWENLAPPPLRKSWVRPCLCELKIRGFENLFNENSAGRCCHGGWTPYGQCSAPCAIRLRVCLMHYQRVLDERPECTFGETVTPVLGGSSFRLDEQPANVSFNNPIVIPFNFSWPETFSLVIEA